VQVAPTTITALCNNDLLADFGQIRDDGFLVFVKDLGPDSDTQHFVFTVFTRALTAHAVLASACKKVLLIPKINEGVQSFDGFDDNITPVAAIAAVWATIFDEFLAPKRNAARTTGTGPDIDLGEIEEFHCFGLSGLFSRGDNLL
jgi:hypothetical protein